MGKVAERGSERVAGGRALGVYVTSWHVSYTGKCAPVTVVAVRTEKRDPPHTHAHH